MNILTVAAKYIPAGSEVAKMFYADGNTCLGAFDPETQEPEGRLSVNIPETNINSEHCWIKNWDENEGILEALVESGLVERLNITQPCGFCEAHLVKILFTQDLRII